MASLFDPEFLARLEYLALVAKRIVRGELRAERITQARGGGVEFADFRKYVAGDDFRYVDWNAYARLGQMLLKMFEEEQDLHVYLLLDVSRSMATGDPEKLRYGKQIVAALAYITLHNLDRAGVALCGPGLLREAPAARGKQRILSLLEFLEQAEAEAGGTDLTLSVEQFLHRPRRRGIVVLVSDLFDAAGFRGALDRLRYSRHQVYVVQVLSVQDREPGALGDLDVIDCETGAVKQVTVTERALASYRRAFERFTGEVARYGREFEVPVAQVFTAMDFESVILDMFRRGGLVR
jgi:uncharacterized protein (DUF58 family)